MEDYSHLIDHAEVKQAAKAELERRRKANFYLQHPYLFHKHVLCPPNLQHNLAKIHEEGLEWLQTGKRKKLILWPRKHLKSTIFTQGESLRKALVDPDIRILISNAKWDNAKRFLGAIKGYLRDPRFIELYGDLLPGPNSKYHRNNDAELTLLSRRNLGLREPTFSTTGLDAAQTSQHYDLIIHDDLVVRQNVGTVDMIEKVITYYKDSLDLLDPQRELWILGTRWHPLDMYGWIIESFCDPRCVDNEFNHVDKCKCDFDVTMKEIKEAGEYIFPTMFNDEEADELLRQKGRYEFAAQYLNNPTDPSVCWFRQGDIEAAKVPAREIQDLRPSLLWYVAVDPAESVDKRACLSAAVAVGVDQTTGIWYVDRADGLRVETRGFIDLCFGTARSYPYATFGLESHTKKALEFALKDAMAREGFYFSITELKPQKAWAGSNMKEARIKRLQPMFEHGRIKIREDLEDLIQALVTIPAARSWDIVDALAYIIDLVPPGMGMRHNMRIPRRVVGWKGTNY